LDGTDEDGEVTNLVQQFIEALKNATGSDHHTGRRYSLLLKGFWFPAPGQTVADAQMTCPDNHNRSVSASNTAKIMPIPQIIEISQYNEQEAQDCVLEPTPFDPFWGSFSGFEAELFGFMPQDNFGFQSSI
jgi:hypothetical protein